MAVIKDAYDIQTYVSQNSSRDIKRRREIRMTLRALNNQVVYWPYDHIKVLFSPVISKQIFTYIPADWNK
jgi:hypothetical protein